MITLSKDQKEALDQIENSPDNIIFITGKAGTGKTTLMKELQYDSVITALTGIAASNIGGRTLHSFLSITPHKMFPHYDKVYDRLFGKKYLIIDEVSMMNEKLLDLVIHTLNEVGFKGKLILIGDFEQLLPVEGRPCKLSKHWAVVREIELTTIHRQKNPELIDFLNKVRDEDFEQDDPFLVSRNCPTPPSDYTAIFPNKSVVENINNIRLDKIDSELVTFRVKILRKSRFLKDTDCLEKIDKQTTFQTTLNLKIGARVMVLVNCSKLRYVNGSCGEVLSIDRQFGVVGVRLDSGEVVDIKPVKREIVDGAGKVLVEYKQVPLALAWATTIHKSQGQSIDKLYVDMNNHFAKGMTYVALSRATNPDTLKVKLCL